MQNSGEFKPIRTSQDIRAMATPYLQEIHRCKVRRCLLCHQVEAQRYLSSKSVIDFTALLKSYVVAVELMTLAKCFDSTLEVSIAINAW